MRRLIFWSTLLYTLGLLGLSVAWQLGVIVWWVALPSIIAPLFFLPLLVLLPLAFWVRWKLYLVCLVMLALLFAFTFGARFLPRAPVKANGDEVLRVMTLNHLKSNTQVAAVGEAIVRQQGDVVALQELSFPVAAMAKEELSALYPYQVLEPASDESMAGMGVLSRFPLEPLRSSDTYRGQRFRVNVAGTALTFINVHFNVPFKDDRTASLRNFQPDKRNRQVDALLAEAAGTERLLVAGDFNLSDNEPGYRKLALHMADAYWRTRVGFGFTYPAAGRYRGIPIPLLVRLDYVWLRGLIPLSASRDCRTSSDHCALIADIALP